jgi:hypothetical protein
MLDALRPQNNVDTALDDLLGVIQGRTGRKLNDVDEVALGLLGDETGRRFENSRAAKPISPIDHEHNAGSAHYSTRQVPVTGDADVEPTDVTDARHASAAVGLDDDVGELLGVDSRPSASTLI